MVSLGVIQPVTQPTDWFSSVAYSQNPMGDGVYALVPRISTELSKEAIITHQSLERSLTNSKVAQYFQSWMPAMVTGL